MQRISVWTLWIYNPTTGDWAAKGEWHVIDHRQGLEAAREARNTYGRMNVRFSNLQPDGCPHCAYEGGLCIAHEAEALAAQEDCA